MNVQPLVLAVDDEPAILRLINLELHEQGFRVITAPNGEEALRIAETQRPDIILLDVLMPDMTGLEVMRRLRERSNVPVILVTAKDSDMDRVGGLEMGADDYVVKPFLPDELGARVRAVLRRAVGATGPISKIRLGEVEIDLDRRVVDRGGEPVRLTRNEWLLLQQLAAHQGKVMVNAELLSKVWGPEYRDDVQYLRVWISRLRRKLEADPANPAMIKTVPGIGYVLEASPETEPASAET
jgi:two-component system KDP operon response regulator KdpE